MTPHGALQIALYCLVLLALTKPVGAYMARVFSGEVTWLKPVERRWYQLLGVRDDEEMPWQTYSQALLVFSAIGMLFTYALLRLQGQLPLNPQGFSGKEMTPDLAFNTAASFTTNTNWQSYVPEATVSYFSNMVALAIHNWMSAAAGIAVALALVRGFARRQTVGLGSFWVDVTRATLCVLLPGCFVYALFLVSQGVPQNFDAYTKVTTLEGTAQTLAQGPVASQECIKMLGTNGGGFFNANSAHPYENPTPLTNFVQMLSIFLIPAGLTYTFGRLVGNTRQGWALFGAMAALFLVGVVACYGAEAAGNNLEGKETRFGIVGSALFAVVTTDASCGAVNAMHDSFTPLGGLVPLVNIQLGEVVFGGVGAGLYGMLMFAVLAVFIAGLMVGRTPEYLGKKIEQYEVKMAMLATLVLAASTLLFTAVGVSVSALSSTTNNAGAHGLSEVLYAYTSATGNNGSAFAGLTANSPAWNVTLGVAMLAGRFLMIVPLLAMAGSLAKKKLTPATSGTFPTDGGTFTALLIGVVVIVGALTYLPALALGPIVEHFQWQAGKAF
ncbi:potassium-transporting ATPase subunit KdpA [Armatimonas rosea]|uniref:Potassium-transporting ATPase potassium-binding subunit n=1 Tax=Armatimonas rosea TaxID=685828 RepID=A0A7W9SU15_ARMRO|nr:potassium-transporting ATPase subunit KdpA [Armatimonas rosea]MBB6052209.1 K+-transporting ATPase ATPase A chain [Armatimonas rosea]